MATQDSTLISESPADTPGTERVSLSGLIDRGMLAWDDALAILRQLAASLDDLHARQIVHGALRPSLIFIDETQKVRISRAQDGESLAGNTEAVLALAPEQLRGESPSKASDQFALALIAYRLTLGRPAFAAEGLAESLFLQCYGILDSSRDTFVDCATQTVFDRALSADPAHRFPSCLDFVEALERIPRRSFSETRLLDREESTASSEAGSGMAATESHHASRAWRVAAAAFSLLAFALGFANWRVQKEVDKIVDRAQALIPSANEPTLRNGQFQVCNVSAAPLRVRELAAAYMGQADQFRVFNSANHVPDGWLIEPGQSSVLSWRVGSDSDWDGAVLFYFLHVEGNGKESVLAGRWNAGASGCLHLD